MDEFARIMGMEGVRPLDQPRDISRRRQTNAPLTVHQPALLAATEPEAADYAWVTGLRARTALDTALDRLAVEARSGRRGWATGIRQDGATVTLSAASGSASLLSAADRHSLCLMIVGGDGWTFVMHPVMGVATLDEDPK